MACGYGCPLTDKDSDIIKRCPLQKVAVWPSRNRFFIKGILAAITSRYENIFIRGIIFVDFSIKHVRYFLNYSWITYLKSTGFNIIIVCDAYMEALANYWMEQDSAIKAVITNRKKIKEIKGIINRIIYGAVSPRKIRLYSLNHDEVRFLELAVSGKSLLSISTEMNTNIKCIYNIKQSLRKKIGISLNELLTK